jgi:glutathione S-transferase
LNALFRFCFESPNLFGIKFATAELDIRKRLYAGLEAAIANYLEQRSGTVTSAAVDPCTIKSTAGSWWGARSRYGLQIVFRDAILLNENSQLRNDLAAVAIPGSGSRTNCRRSRGKSQLNAAYALVARTGARPAGRKWLCAARSFPQTTRQ